MTAPVVAPVVELRVWGVERVAPALVRMATGRLGLRGTPGLRFAKLLGTGSGDTFTPRDADPRHWALLTVHDDAAGADRFAGSRVPRSWDRVAHERLRVRMVPLVSRGRWSRTEPFAGAGEGVGSSYDGPVAAITRARLRTRRAVVFWRAVPPVVAELRAAPGLRLALGIGEAPVGLQGTFSIWEGAGPLNDFAYRSPAHVRAVRETPQQRWYAEELFARFAVLDVDGLLDGRAP